MSNQTDSTFYLWNLLTQARDAVFNARNRELSKYGITGRESATLDAVSRIGSSATPTKVARWLYRKPHAITSILSRMQKKGLVKLTKDAKIRNLVRIAITRKGQLAYKEALKRESIHEIFQVVPADKFEEFESCLKLVRDAALEKYGHNQELDLD